MSAPRFRPLTPAVLAEIEDPCGHCGYGFSRPSVTDHFGRTGSRLPAWAEEVADLWGACGVGAHLNGDIPGYLTFAPSELVPSVPLPAPGGSSAEMFSPDAAVLLAVAVCRDYRGRGIGKNLVRTAIAQLTKRQVGLVEVIGTFGVPGVPHADGSREASVVLLPVSFWQAMGFRIVRPHPITPTLRLDVSSTVRWRPDFAAAWQRFADLVAQPGPPQPASYHRRVRRRHDVHTRRPTHAA